MQSPVAPPAASLPSWALWFSFAVSVGVSIVALLRLRPASLDLLLTRETFFRVLTTGENVFANAVLLARNGSVVVQSAVLELEKTSGSQKQFPLNVVHVGEKVRSTNVMAEHFFYSSSPMDFLPADVPKRVLYLGQLRDYATAATATWEAFERWLASYKTEKGLGIGPITDTERGKEILAEIEPPIKEHAARFMDGLQLEGGEYRLTLKIRYRDPAYFISFSREVESAISFSLPADIKDRFREPLYRALTTWAIGSITNQTANVVYPEYAPTAVTELSEVAARSLPLPKKRSQAAT